MWGGIAAIALAGGFVPGGASALNAPNDLPHGRCELLGSDKLRQAVPTSSGICEEVERAIAARAPGARYQATVTLMSASRIAAKLVVNGHTLPIQNFAVMDANLSDASIKRFAAAVAAAVFEASRT